ncbi:MAG TPA: MFS transporter [Thermoanaerobaculia bacterium]|nr:MFS transporter [Thermoanaerobaculia bacterium]
MTRNRWFRAGDANAFFALMFDNVANLVILVTILVGVFDFPRDLVLRRIVPGTAVGVLVGDLLYAWMARRLARRTGRTDVTAMPLGLNAPSVFGMSFAVLGPAYLATGDAVLSWKMGMAVTVLVGLFKMGLAFAGNAVRSFVPRAGLLGSIAGAGIALIAFLPFLKVFSSPIVGFAALGIILVTLVAGVRLPFGLPGAFVSVVVGVALHYVLVAAGFGPAASAAAPAAEGLALAIPWPSLAFLGGLSLAWAYLPIALPFAVMTIVGGIDNTESAAAAGDEYDTRGILMTEGFCTFVAGLCGGVVESTPYIGHPAFKKMGAGAGYAVATALFVGLGGMLGYLPFLVGWIPAAAVAPILVYIGLEVVAQGYLATPARHGPAISLAILPSLAFLVSLQVGSVLAAAGTSAANLTGETGETFRAIRLLGNGFIVTALLWGAAGAEVIDGRFRRGALYFAASGVLCLFGVIHSPAAQGTFFLPWRIADPAPMTFAAGYLTLALIVLAASLRGRPLAPEPARKSENQD